MSKKFNIREWILSVKYWSLLFIPHTSICLIFIIYMLIGASIIQEIESEEYLNSSAVRNIHKERERLLLKIIEKRQTLDLEHYTKYVYRHIRQYEVELKKQADLQENSTWNFSNSLFFIGTTLTTIGNTYWIKTTMQFLFLQNCIDLIRRLELDFLLFFTGSNEFAPKTNIGKFFLIIYTGFGIPLTLVFLTDLSYVIKGLIESISLLLFSLYSSKYFIRIRRLGLLHWVEKQFDMFPQQGQVDSTEHTSHIHETFERNLTIIQLIITLMFYIVIGTWFIPSNSFFDSIYLCFTAMFTISFNRKINGEKNLFFTSIYLLVGLAIGLLCIKTVKMSIERFLVNCGKKLLRNLVEFTKQLGYHNLSTEDLLADTNMNVYPMGESGQGQTSRSLRAKSIEQQTTLRPVGIAEPFRRLSSGIIRTLKINDNDSDKHLDKSVQVTTIIRRCGRCAETTLPILPVRKRSLMSTSSPSFTDNSSGGDDDDTMDFPPPNLDRIRQRRATLVAKTIINQMATQPRTSSTDDVVPSLTLLTNQRHRSSNSSLNSVTCSVKVSGSLSPEEAQRKHAGSQEEFSQLSKQIAALLTPSDDEN